LEPSLSHRHYSGGSGAAKLRRVVLTRLTSVQKLHITAPRRKPCHHVIIPVEDLPEASDDGYSDPQDAPLRFFKMIEAQAPDPVFTSYDAAVAWLDGDGSFDFDDGYTGTAKSNVNDLMATDSDDSGTSTLFPSDGDGHAHSQVSSTATTPDVSLDHYINLCGLNDTNRSFHSLDLPSPSSAALPILFRPITELRSKPNRELRR
jgi:hypothetical protein